MRNLGSVRRRALVTAAVVVAAALPPMAPSGLVAGQTCHPIQTEPDFRGVTPTPEGVLGFSLGSQEVTTAEASQYIAAVDGASDRVVSGTFGTSVEGRPLEWAIIGDPENVTPHGLDEIQAAVALLMDPTTPGTVAAQLSETTPAILLVQANVHGGEESGTDASLRILYELADRVDCVADRVLDNAIVVMIPIQNPDGREAETRRNAFSFDLNRDWFARTQPETDAKLDFLRQYPAQLDLDLHEFGLSYAFFPPNSDPVYHEHPDEAIEWINGLYGPALATEFERQKIRYFNFEPYDFFGVFFGDTVPTDAYHAAGMTIEKNNGDPLAQRLHEVYTVAMVSLFEAGTNKARILREWHASWVDAFQEGVAGELEPNAVFQKGHRLREPVPTAPVRHYFLLDDLDKQYELARLVRRLQRMDVDVYRLTGPLAVPDFHPYGRPATQATLPAGTYWIPMAQAHKHWVQAMLHEDTYIPHDVTFDVTAWSNPLLMNLEGGYSGAILQPPAAVVPPAAEPMPPPLPSELPSVAVFEGPGNTALESRAAVHWLFQEVWGLPFTFVTGADIAAGALAGQDVLVMPDQYSNSGLQALGVRGRKAIVQWVNGGGRLIAWEGSAEIATRIGASTAVLQMAQTNMPGSLVRVRLDEASPLAAGVGPSAWVMFENDPKMQPGLGTAPVTFPPADSEDFFVSGLDDGAGQLGATAAVADEPVGAGRSIVLTFDPAFRGWTEGTERILRNAVLGPDPAAAGRSPVAAGSKARRAAERAARQAALALPDAPSPWRVWVSPADVGTTRSLLGQYGAQFDEVPAAGKVLFLVANPEGLAFEEHPYAARLLRDLQRVGVEVAGFSAS
jgi:hypothetical protein